MDEEEKILDLSSSRDKMFNDNIDKHMSALDAVKDFSDMLRDILEKYKFCYVNDSLNTEENYESNIKFLGKMFFEFVGINEFKRTGEPCNFYYLLADLCYPECAKLSCTSRSGEYVPEGHVQFSIIIHLNNIGDRYSGAKMKGYCVTLTDDLNYIEGEEKSIIETLEEYLDLWFQFQDSITVSAE